MGNTTSRNDRPNEGEGNRTADRNYREATRKFVESPRGKEEIRKVGDMTPEEARKIRQAEEQAKSRAKEHDPEEVRDRKRPS